MIVYHGSIQMVEKPDVGHSCHNLDFGNGFYVTTVKDQAERWARRKADLAGASKGVVTTYEMSEARDGFIVKDFGDDLDNWIDFVCDCREGGDLYKEYDQIAFVSQKAIDGMLEFMGSYEVKTDD